MSGPNCGYSKVTPASLQVKDHTVYPPDRVVFTYWVKDGNGGKKTVVGTWGDYLRDRDQHLTIDGNAPLDNEHNPDNVMLITDLYPGIPDKVFIPDPMRVL